MYNFECIFLCQVYFVIVIELVSYIFKLSAIQGKLVTYLTTMCRNISNIMDLFTSSVIESLIIGVENILIKLVNFSN